MHKTVMIDLPSPWDDDSISRGAACRGVDRALDEAAGGGWILVCTEVIAHLKGNGQRVLLATFRRGKARGAEGGRGAD